MFPNRGEDNHWIVKAWNLARAMDAHVTDDVDFIVRLADERTPKVVLCNLTTETRLVQIVSKYIERPLLFTPDEKSQRRTKFDLRYIIVLRSIEPFDARMYSRFWLRFALKSFDLTELDDYEKHFTVHNYDGNAKEMVQVSGS